MKNNNSIGCTTILIVYGIYLSVWCFLTSILAFWTRYEISSWVTYTKGVPTTVPYWVGWVASIPFPITFFADIISVIVRQFI